jgi:hypothetical protein
VAYCAYADVNEYLGGALTADQTLITNLIPRAQAEIDRLTGRTFEASTNTTRYFTVGKDTDGPYLYFDRDLCAVNSITNGDSDTLASTEYTTIPKSDTPYYAVKLLGSSGLAWTYLTDPENAIQVSGKWAFSETAPADIKHACIRLTAYFYKQKDSIDQIGQTQMTPEGNLLLPSRIPPDVVTLLAPFKRRL